MGGKAMRGVCCRMLLCAVVAVAWSLAENIKITTEHELPAPPRLVRNRNADVELGSTAKTGYNCWWDCGGGRCAHCGKNAAGDLNYCCRWSYGGCPGWNWGAVGYHSCNTAPLPPPPPQPKIEIHHLVDLARDESSYPKTTILAQGDVYLYHGHARVAKNCRMTVKIWVTKKWGVYECPVERIKAGEKGLVVRVEAKNTEKRAACDADIAFASATLRFAGSVEYHGDTLHFPTMWAIFGHSGTGNDLIKSMSCWQCALSQFRRPIDYYMEQAKNCNSKLREEKQFGSKGERKLKDTVESKTSRMLLGCADGKPKTKTCSEYKVLRQSGKVYCDIAKSSRRRGWGGDARDNCKKSCGLCTKSEGCTGDHTPFTFTFYKFNHGIHAGKCNLDIKVFGVTDKSVKVGACVEGTCSQSDHLCMKYFPLASLSAEAVCTGGVQYQRLQHMDYWTFGGQLSKLQQLYNHCKYLYDSSFRPHR